ncbi:2-polyprenyl-6-methoxyphenol hydroxylase-like FAD-dependent oxidoreductase [Flavobacterium nitrogenifigens]|uniref:2-polyprenyl-6-methoxyphenol hydroxylase-like FAD-dependent oxidoreductase n=2 Tax=Flavobacterium TaxID=237 RepID=A0A7W7IY38_9FLAO|nr:MULTISPECIES: NAD(P)/FAD-dependent oxidoreductase [Flavobacterium]MBB4802642.1 2-polyprenyl-6-methoxyphenol hydroxylase-like FAD-dependent oxidoreductase [Flavobacterium nitrogenifigens]MBB6387600.1 2-polyprenyl-6-methoxyphenol hydroxylase-like FAD-dependent oxidoreductase [Flavobacterium notoginsengisoli]
MWTICPECQGQGKKSQRLTKKVRLQYQSALEQFEKNNSEGIAPTRPKAPKIVCLHCSGSGLVQSENPVIPNKENYPHVAIIGAGIGGVALAVACLHRGIPFTIYERDENFESRSQGYGLTLQQASKAIHGLGIFSLNGVVSTRHLVHTVEGKVIGEWGIRKWLESEEKKETKRTNIHIARQALRLALLEQLGGQDKIQWKHQLIDFRETENDKIDLTFQVNGETKTVKTDLLVGADGIRSSVRRILIGDNNTPLRYLDCIVILGICPLSSLKDVNSPLLDSATVFQTANGHERIYIMPYDTNSVMWQLSFPMLEEEAKTLSLQGPKALKEEAIRRTQWHNPIPQILLATEENKISGYPVYDRELLSSELLSKGKQITLIGDAAHPMSPFKGQGANQALLDALSLARKIFKGCKSVAHWKKAGIRESVLTEFETEMLKRSAVKVKDSAKAAEFLHSEIVLHEANEPRGRCLKKKDF